MKKKKNAFTLIELLAIIVILAIIAVITVPIILNIIENSRKGAATDSAYGYKDSVNKTYVAELQNHNKLKLNDTYTVTNGTLSGGNFGDEEITSLPVSVSGTIPSSGSLIYENNVLKSGYLVIGDYRVTFNQDGTVTTTKNTGSSSTEVSNGEQSEKNYTYYGYGTILEDPTGYDFDYDDYQEPYNNECPSEYAYYEGDDEYDAGCYYYEHHCDNGYYNSETGKCEGEGFHNTTTLSDEWKIYVKNDGTTYEICGVFGSGHEGTTCLTSSFYNNDYSTAGSYGSDFENLSTLGTWTTASELSATGLKGYSLTKAQEMLSNGGYGCNLQHSEMVCYMSSGGGCYIYGNGNVTCVGGNNFCKVSSDGSYHCQ